MPLRTMFCDQVSKLTRRAALGLFTCCLFLAAAIFYGDNVVTSASAVGEERTLSMYNIHTKETITVTFKRDGRYIPSAMDELNWFMRDWRRDEETQMDPELIDLIWELSQELGVTEPIHLISGFRSQATNDALRRAGRRVARRSQHIQGKASDIYFPGVPIERLRNSALVREVGGVGYYPRSGQHGFVHVDTGRVRHWPRIGEQQMARIFEEHRQEVERAREERSGPVLLAGADEAVRSPENHIYPLPDDKPTLTSTVEDPVTDTEETQETPAVTEPIVVASAPVQENEIVAQPGIAQPGIAQPGVDQPEADQTAAPVDAAANLALASAAPLEESSFEPTGQRSLMFFPLAILNTGSQQETSGYVQTASLQPQNDGTFQEVAIMRGSVDELTAEERELLARFQETANRPREFSSREMERITGQIAVQSSKGSLQMSAHTQGPEIANGRGGRLDAPETIIDLINGTVEPAAPVTEESEPSAMRLGLEDAVRAPGDADGEQPISVLAGSLQ